jgi:carboxypeptidase family protein
VKNFIGGLCLTVAAAAASGQGIPLATLTGTVTAEDGTPIAGVMVTADSPSLQGSRQAVTSRTGEYLLALLPPGEYRVRFAAAATTEVTRTVTLPAAASVRVHAVLRPAPLSESVTVSGESASERGPEVEANFPQKLIETLPSGRSLRDTALLAPGVNENGPSSSLGSASQRPAMMISGAVSYENLFLVNGVVVNENLRGQPQDLFIEDAIQETTVQTGRISAEYGRFLGGVVNVVTRSGGNRVSGSFRTTLSSDQWTANNAFDSGLGVDNRASDINTSYEATFGLPVVRDHLWAFGAGRYANVGQTFETRPLALPGNSGLEPVPYSYGRKERRLEGKLTAAPAPAASVVASYIDNRLDETNYAFNRSILSTETLMPRTLPNSLLAVNATGVVSGTLFLEGQYSRRRFEIDQGGANSSDPIEGTHIFDVAGARRFGAPQFGGEPPNHFDNDSWSLRSSTLLSSPFLGDHELKLGYDYFRESSLRQNDFSGSGFWINEQRSIIRGTQVFPSFSNDGSTLIQWFPILAPAARTDLVTHSAYVNDLLRLGRHWSVNLGLRWDKNHDTNSDGVLVSNSSSWSPRLDVRFDPRGDGRIVFDAGYGKYVAKLHDNLANAASPAGQPGQFNWTYAGPCINCSVSAPTGSLLSKDEALFRLFAWFNSIGGTEIVPTAGASLPGFSTRLAPGGLKSPYVREASAGAEAALGSRGSARADLLYRDYRDSYNGRLDLTTGQTPPDEFGNVYDIEEIGNSDDVVRRYIAAQFQARYGIGAHVTVTAMYTWSHLTGNFLGEFNRDSATWAVIDEYPEYKQARWNSPYGDITGEGVAPFSPDQRHRARLWVVYSVPIGAGILSVSGLESFDSGLGYEAVGAIDPRPYVSNPGYANPLGSSRLGSGLVAYFFTRPGAYRTDNITHTDVALDWAVPMFESVEVFIHPQVFNLFNEQGVIAVDTTVSTARTDKTLAAFNPFTDSPREGVNYRLGPNFGKPTSSAGYQAPRTFQLGLGLRF